MFAFYKDQNKVYKLYDHQDDWQVIHKEGDTNRERWFSVWRQDKIGSAHNAMMSCVGADYNKENLVIC
jgi:hypothetical protein